MSVRRAGYQWIAALPTLALVIVLTAAGSAEAARPAVVPTPTTTTLSVSPAVPRGTQDMRIRYSVSPFPEQGSAKLLIDGKVEVLTLPLDHLGEGTYEWQLPLGTHSVQIHFDGFRDFAASDSPLLMVTQAPHDATLADATGGGTVSAGAERAFGATSRVLGKGLRGFIAVGGTLSDGTPVATNGADGAIDPKTGRFPTWPMVVEPGRWEVVGWMRDTIGRYLDTASCPVTVKVAPRTVDPTLTSTRTTMDWGQVTTIRYRAWPANARTPEPVGAEVAFFLDDAGAPFSVKRLVDGAASTPWAPGALGKHRITARLRPSTWFKPAERAVSITVVRGVAPAPPAPRPGATATSTSIVGPTAPQPWGTAVPIAISVTPATGGSVKLYDGAQFWDTLPVDSHGRAALTRSLAPGTYRFAAVYQGTAKWKPSTSPVATVTVEATPTTTTLSIEDATLDLRDTLRATAHVEPIPGRGKVSFDGTLVPVDPVTGDATIEIDQLPTGDHTLTATFTGDEPLGPSTSKPAAYSVAKLDSAISLVVNADGAVPVADSPPHGRAVLVFEVTPNGPRTDAPGIVEVLVDGIVAGTTVWPGEDRISVWLPPGRYTAMARFRGSRALRPSESATIDVQVGDRDSRPATPAGTATLRGGPVVQTPIVLLDVRPTDGDGAVRAFQISNDGERWATWEFDMRAAGPALKIPWSLVNPDCGGRAADGPRTIHVRLLSHVLQPDGVLVSPKGDIVRSDEILIPVDLQR